MAEQKISTTLSEQWFLDRVGKYVYASSSGFNGQMKIENDDHARYLCFTSQKYFHYRFSDLDRQPFEAESEG